MRWQLAQHDPAGEDDGRLALRKLLVDDTKQAQIDNEAQEHHNGGHHLFAPSLWLPHDVQEQQEKGTEDTFKIVFAVVVNGVEQAAKQHPYDYIGREERCCELGPAQFHQVLLAAVVDRVEALKMEGLVLAYLEIVIPEARVRRMDLDSTRSKYSYQKIIDEFENGEIDILVGTQMVSKGLDFDGVELVGVFDADRIIHFPDFRSQTCRFQTSLKGRRSGRQLPRPIPQKL